MGRNVDPPADLITHIKRLENRIINLERGRRLRPYIQLNYLTNTSYNNPATTTTSTTFASLYRITGLQQHPAVEARLRVVAGAGTSGTIQLYDSINDYTIWTASVGSGFSGEVVALGNLSTAIRYGEHFSFEIQAQRVDGTGTIGVLPLYVYGREKI